MLKFIFSKINRKYRWIPQGIEYKNQDKFLKEGDTVEYAIMHSKHQYKIESINAERTEAKIKRINPDGSLSSEQYVAPLGMLRAPEYTVSPPKIKM